MYVLYVYAYVNVPIVSIFPWIFFPPVLSCVVLINKHEQLGPSPPTSTEDAAPRF